MGMWPKRRFYRGLLVLGLLFVGVVVVDQVWVAWNRRLTIGPATTRITGPIVGGYPDYLAAMNAAQSAGVSVENNAAIMLHAIVDVPQTPAGRGAVFRIWNVADAPAAARVVPFKDWLKATGQDVPAGGMEVQFEGVAIPPYEDPASWVQAESGASPWSKAARPRVALWLREISPALDQAEAACKLPKYYVPVVTPSGRSNSAAEGAVLSALMPSLGGMRDLANALTARAMMRLNDGDSAGVSRDILTCARLARLLAQQPNLIGHLVAVAIDSAAMNSVKSAAVTDRLSAAEAKALREELTRLGPMPTVGQAIDQSDRYTMLDAWCTIHHGKQGSGAGILSAATTVGRVVPINYNEGMRKANALFDRIVEIDIQLGDLTGDLRPHLDESRRAE